MNDPMRRRMVQSMTGADDGRPYQGRWIPLPHVPVQPVMSVDTVFGERQAVPSLLDLESKAFTTAGRMAIALALEAEGIGAGDEVLVPAYHCSAMIEPVVALGAKPVFYRIGADLAVDVADLTANHSSRTRALLAANYFGFPQDWSTLRAWAEPRRVLVIEDCAHALFGTLHGKPLGSFGDYAIASLPKFLPVWDGGCLVGPKSKLAMHPQHLTSQIKAFIDPVEDAVRHGRLQLLRPLTASLDLARAATRRFRSSAKKPLNPAHMRSGGGGEFDRSWIRVEATIAARAVTRIAARGRIAARRVAAYTRYLAAFSGLPGCHPLFSSLPPGVVPFMFPLWIDRLPEVFPGLEDRAVPMQRFGQFLWPDVSDGVCINSTQLSRHLIQLPCHQDLNDAEIDWVTDQVRESVGAASR